MREFGKRHGWIGGLLYAVVCILLDLYVPRGTFGLAMGPALGVGLAAGAGALMKAIGSQPGYRPNRSNLRHYEGLQREDIDRLYGADPYGGSDLGLNKTQMAAQTGDQDAEAQAEYKGQVGDIERDAASGNLRPLSGAYYRAKQGALSSMLGRVSDIRRRNLIADAYVRREDFDRRARLVSNAYDFGAGLASGQPRNPLLAGVGGALTGGAGAYATATGGQR